MRFIKTILFHILSTFRGIFLAVFGFLSGAFIIGFILALLFGSPLKVKIHTFIFGVGFSALCWYYDVLLLKLQPDNVNLMLFD